MIEKIAIKFTQSLGSVWSLLIHTILFCAPFVLYFLGVELDKILLVLTTIVSLEAIYLSIFIQMSVNHQSKKLQTVQEDMEDIQKDVEEIQEDIEEIQEDVEEIQEEDEEDDDDDDDDSDLQEIKETLEKLMKEVIDLKKQYKNNRLIKKSGNEKN